MKRVMKVLFVTVVAAGSFWWWARPSEEELVVEASANRVGSAPDPRWAAMFDGLAREWETVRVPESQGSGK